MRSRVELTLKGSFLFVALCCSHHGQTLTPGQSTFSTTPSTRTGLSADQKAKMESKRLRRAFQKLKSDSEKLVVGSAELKEMIRKSNPHVYSIEIIKKAEDLEKLAKKIKNQVKRGFH